MCVNAFFLTHTVSRDWFICDW